MISDFCIRRPIFASVLSIVVTLAGLAALVGLPIEQYPPIAPPQVTVTASFPGADAETVAQAVAAPIETQVNGADNMLYMQSTSSSTGQMTLTVFFQIGTDPDTAQVQVQNRVNIALPRLPDIVQKTGVRVEKRSSSIMMLLAVYAPDGRYDVNYVANYANLYVLDAIKRVPGANQASLFGAADNAMRIWLRPDRMASRGITPTDVQNGDREAEPAVQRGRHRPVADVEARRDHRARGDRGPLQRARAVREHHPAHGPGGRRDRAAR